MDQKPKLTERKYLIVFIFVTSLFMLWGIAITMGDVLNTHFQKALHVSKAESALVQFSIFGAYAVMGIPAGLFMKRFGYKNGVLFGLSLYAIGAFMFIPASNAESFGFFRIALFILACGLATLETVAHPFVASLGDQRTSDQRINFAQTFNGAGAVIGPLLGKFFVFGTLIAATDGPLTSVKVLYTVIAIIIAAIAISFSFVKVPALTDPHVIATDTYAIAAEDHVDKGLFSKKHFVFAVAAQFFNVAAQGGTWAFFINYGHDVMHMEHDEASGYMSAFMVMMILGRAVGTALMRYIKPYKLLAIFAFGSIVSCLIIAQAWGWVSFAALFALNFFFSIMFPTIFSLGLKDLGAKTQQGSSFIVMGVVGGAVFPYLMGLIADKNVAHAYYLPIICYSVIFFFGFLYPKLNKNYSKVV